jgi:methylated-DNA-[protein]-cysteine S-methyltransferase
MAAMARIRSNAALEESVIYTCVTTAIGELLAARNDEGAITRIHFTGATAPETWRRDDAAFADVREQLHAYFAGELHEFSLPLAPAGTPFQQSVWTALRAIPYGQTRSYLEIATAIGKPSACRAVGAANGANPLPIVVPCHRVIGANGTLTGFGGGIDVKRQLLALEGVPPIRLF